MECRIATILNLRKRFLESLDVSGSGGKQDIIDLLVLEGRHFVGTGERQRRVPGQGV